MSPPALVHHALPREPLLEGLVLGRAAAAEVGPSRALGRRAPEIGLELARDAHEALRVGLGAIVVALLVLLVDRVDAQRLALAAVLAARSAANWQFYPYLKPSNTLGATTGCVNQIINMELDTV